MLKVAIVDDNKDRAMNLSNYIHRYETDCKNTFEVTIFVNAIDFVSDYRPNYDVIFIETDMSLTDGFSVSQRLRRYDREVCIVFTSSNERYAVRGYEVRAMGYLIRPYDYYIFSDCMHRVIDHLYDRPEAETMISADGTLRRVQVRDIKFVEVLGHSLVWHLTYGEITANGQLVDLEEKYNRYGFFRCNKSYLVNLHHITSVQSDVVYVGDTAISISRRKKKDFQMAFGEYAKEKKL